MRIHARDSRFLQSARERGPAFRLPFECVLAPDCLVSVARAQVASELGSFWNYELVDWVPILALDWLM